MKSSWNDRSDLLIRPFSVRLKKNNNKWDCNVCGGVLGLWLSLWVCET